jgi:hypothetical protein
VSNGCGTLTFAIANQPSWAGFDSGTGALTGTPDAADAGLYADIVITVTDELSDSSSLAAFAIQVCNAPQISGAPVTSIAAGNGYSFTPSVSGGCGTLTYAIANQPSWASFDTGTGALTGTPILADIGTTSGIVISVTDQNGLSADLAGFAIQVTAGCDAPVISGAPDTGVVSGNAYSFVPTVSNGCGTLTFAIANQPSWAGFDSGTGALTGTPDAVDAGLYADIVITVTDELSDRSSLTSFDIEVADTDSSGGGGGGGGGGCFITALGY